MEYQVNSLWHKLIYTLYEFTYFSLCAVQFYG